jgi:hypothetical protein
MTTVEDQVIEEGRSRSQVQLQNPGYSIEEEVSYTSTLAVWISSETRTVETAYSFPGSPGT